MKKFELMNIVKTASYFLLGAGFQAIIGKHTENWFFKAEIVAKKIEDQKIFTSVTETKKNYITLSEKITNLDEKISNYFKNEIRITPEQKESLLKLKENIQESGNIFQEIINKDPNSESITVGRQIVNKILVHGSEYEKLIREILSENDKNNFIPSLSPEILSEFFDSLTFGQLAAFLNIIIFFLLVLTVFSILSALFGNEIIKYFKIEEKYPRLNTFFKIRSTLQKYYLMWNILTLFGLCLLGIGFDIYIFYRYI